ncbi:Cytochrome P450 monooxygenase patI [Lachnellula cervina]|uniref:Cytochrome P450 monooxygenase patI n=1 Tax=Lachnellula cervina TaxID=1316786 RepID=A0A7D8YSV3_9HELO|nr:Cytochrome P450 monooxygenase patI [Lachnellula cervina]
MMDQRVCFYSIAGLLTAVLARYLATRGRKKYKFPPLVPGIPIMGNALQVPPTQQGPWAKSLADKYGEMFTVKFGGSTWVFLNSTRVVTDLMEKRAAIYSSRPPFPMTQDIMSGGSRVVLMPYGDRWRKTRKIMHQILSTRQKDTFQDFQELESRHLLYDYLHHPDRWFSANGRYANSVIMSVVFGIRSKLDDPDVTALFETVEMFLEQQQPGLNLVDGFPSLAKLPEFLQWWRPRGLRMFEYTRGVYKKQLDNVKARIEKGTQKNCFAVDFLKNNDEKYFNETQQLFTLGTLMEAGSDTTRVSVGQLIAGAATYPDWVVRARAQLDEVCGSNADRLPSWEDKEKLPYIAAVVKEVFRWRPNIAEIGAPTSSTKDDEYEEYSFPAGTVFVWNAWAIALNPKEYEQPERFWPERFLNDDLNNGLKGHWAFGPGRRVCVGWNVGEMNVWIAAARLLYCFDFIEDKANPIDTMNIPQVTKNKAPFPVIIKVRSSAHAALIERDCLAATKAN